MLSEVLNTERRGMTPSTERERLEAQQLGCERSGDTSKFSTPNSKSGRRSPRRGGHPEAAAPP
jgi:hypothetical protein